MATACREVVDELVQVLASTGLVKSGRRTGITVLEPKQWDALLGLEIRLHRLLLAASGNPFFTGLGEVIEGVLHGRTDQHLIPLQPQPRRWHTLVAQAVRRGDGAAARSPMATICREVAVEPAGPSGTG